MIRGITTQTDSLVTLLEYISYILMVNYKTTKLWLQDQKSLLGHTSSVLLLLCQLCHETRALFFQLSMNGIQQGEIIQQTNLHPLSWLIFTLGCIIIIARELRYVTDLMGVATDLMGVTTDLYHDFLNGPIRLFNSRWITRLLTCIFVALGSYSPATLLFTCYSLQYGDWS